VLWWAAWATQVTGRRVRHGGHVPLGCCCSACRGPHSPHLYRAKVDPRLFIDGPWDYKTGSGGPKSEPLFVRTRASPTAPPHTARTPLLCSAGTQHIHMAATTSTGGGGGGGGDRAGSLVDEMCGRHAALVRCLVGMHWPTTSRRSLRRIVLALVQNPQLQAQLYLANHTQEVEQLVLLIHAPRVPDDARQRPPDDGGQAAAAAAAAAVECHPCPRCGRPGARCEFLQRAQSQMGSCPALTVAVWHCSDAVCGDFNMGGF